VDEESDADAEPDGSGEDGLGADRAPPSTTEMTSVTQYQIAPSFARAAISASLYGGAIR
jgi:hypothetical protein